MSHHTHFVECGLSVENNDIIVNYMAFNLQKEVSKQSASNYYCTFYQYLEIDERFVKNNNLLCESSLTHSFPMHPFSTPWKHQKNLMFSVSRELGRNELRSYSNIEIPFLRGLCHFLWSWVEKFALNNITIAFKPSETIWVKKIVLIYSVYNLYYYGTWKKLSCFRYDFLAMTFPGTVLHMMDTDTIGF